MRDAYILEFYKSLNCSKSLAAWILYKHGEYEQLVDLEFDPYHYNDINQARDSLAAVKFLSKNKFLKININRRSLALEKFFDSEKVCKDANQRLRKTSQFDALIYRASEIIAFVLNPRTSHDSPDIDGEEFVDSCNWGPGATVSMQKRFADSPKKYQMESDITPIAYDFVKDWFESAYPTWYSIREGFFRIQSAAKLVTVPKNAKIDRTIAIEPGLNLWFQKGIGRMIRRRLLRIGIDLNDQSHNQRLSRIASKFNHLATVDFSSASDTISIRIVERLLPPSWFRLLSTFRSNFVTLDGKTIQLEKFSSMGNGFTFELESLIFYALARAAHESLSLDKNMISVFGDDVILSSSAVDLYTDLCAYCGFSVNVKKSYSSSYYRESCGSHYWNGVDIKPIFQKEDPYDSAEETIKAANNIRRLAHRRNTYGCDRRLLYCWQILVSNAKLKTKLFVSDNYGDVAFIGNIEEASGLKRAPFQMEGWRVPVYAAVPVCRITYDSGLLLAKLRVIGSSDGSSFGNEVPKPLRTRVSRKRILVPRWYDLGPWC